jgi:hypothetical protein
MPLAGLLWSFELVRDQVQAEMTRRLSGVPPEKIVSPPPMIAVPALGLLRLVAEEPSLREMYLRLLATSMDERTASLAHPSFPEIIRQLTPDEAALFASLDPDREQSCLALVDGVRLDSLSVEVIIDHFAFEPPTRVKHHLLAANYIDNLQRLALIANMALNSQVYRPQMEALRERFPSIGLEFADFISSERVQIFEVGLKLTSFGKQFYRACVRGEVVPSVATPNEQ